MTQPLTKRSATLDRDAEYTKPSKVSRLPGYLTIQMMRFQFKQKDAVNAKILKDIKFPMMLDTFELCTEDLQQKLVPMRTKFKVRPHRRSELQAFVTRSPSQKIFFLILWDNFLNNVEKK